MKACGVFAFKKGDDILKNIQIIEGAWCLEALYKEANTPAKRALVGYMLKTCKADNTLYGGALYLLRDIESCKGNIYCLEPCMNADKAKKIIHIAEMSLEGKYKRFTLSKREIRKMLKHLERKGK